MTTDPYHMSRPDMAEARAAIERLYAHEAGQVWQKLLTSAGLSGRETDPGAVERLAETMLAADPVLALSGRGLMIRIKSYEYLLAAAQMISEAPEGGPAPAAAPGHASGRLSASAAGHPFGSGRASVSSSGRTAGAGSGHVASGGGGWGHASSGGGGFGHASAGGGGGGRPSGGVGAPSSAY